MDLRVMGTWLDPWLFWWVQN